MAALAVRGCLSLLCAALSGATTSTQPSAWAVPVVDLSTPRAEAAKTVDEALRSYGFFYVCNHGVPERLLAEQFEQSRALFALPAEVKRNLTFVPHLNIGYLGIRQQALDKKSGVPDSFEGFVLTNNGVMDPHFLPNETDPLQGAKLHWPPENRLPRYQAVMRAYARYLTGLTHKLNALLFAALGLSEAERVALASRPFTVLKQLRYEAVPEMDKVEQGAGAHADWGSLTILATDGTPGLQVQLNGTWLPVPPKAGCLMVNAGDQVAHWTNGEYMSSYHRVMSASPKPRYSTAFFTYFDFDTPVAPLAQFVGAGRPALAPARTSREHMRFKISQSTGESERLDEMGACPSSGCASEVVG